MHGTIFDLIDSKDRARYPEPSDLLSAPLDVLHALPAALRTELRTRYAIHTVADLRKLDLEKFQIDPGILQRLVCLLFYPKHDPGPSCDWEKLFEAAPLATYTGYGSTFHTHFGPVFYRGRLDSTAKVLVVGQDPSTDETLSGRIFVGQAGQLAQNFLAKIGITRSYLMFNTFLYGVQSGSITTALATDPAIAAYRNQLFDKAKATNPITLVLAFGGQANTAVGAWPGLGALKLIHVTHPTAPSGVASDWNSHLATAAAAVTPEAPVDLTPYSTTGALPTTDVPRFDLPFGTPTWQGTGGATRSQRVSGAFETQITWTAP